MSKKLLQLQQTIGAISKDSTNPFYKSKYFDINGLIEALKPHLNTLGLVLLQPLTTVIAGNEIKPAIRTILIDSDTGNKLIDDAIILPQLPDPQKFGSAVTYFRRYAIQSCLFLQAEDDDANLTINK